MHPSDPTPPILSPTPGQTPPGHMAPPPMPSERAIPFAHRALWRHWPEFRPLALPTAIGIAVVLFLASNLGSAPVAGVADTNSLPQPLAIGLVMLISIPVFSGWVRALSIKPTPPAGVGQSTSSLPSLRLGQPELAVALCLGGFALAGHLALILLGGLAEWAHYYRSHLAIVIGLVGGLVLGPMLARLALMPAYAALGRLGERLNALPRLPGPRQGFALAVAYGMGSLTLSVPGILFVVMATGGTAAVIGSADTSDTLPLIAKSISAAIVITYATGLLAGLSAYAVMWCDGTDPEDRFRDLAPPPPDP